MAMQLRPCYDKGDGATLSLRFCILSIQLTYVHLYVNDICAQVAILQLAIMNHRLIMLDDEVRAIRRQRAKRFWVRPFLSADRGLQFGHYDQLVRALRLEDSS